MGKNGIAHTKWNCKYHVLCAPKFRRKVIYNQLRVDIGKMLRMLCDRKGVEIIEAELCLEHVHMLITIPPKMSVSGAIGYLKGKSTLGKNAKAIQEYIANQLKEDKLQDDLSSKEYVDPFTGKRVRNLCYLNSNPGNVVHAMNNSERNLARPVG